MANSMGEQGDQAIAVVGALAYDQISRTDTALVQTGSHLLNCKLVDLTQAFGGCAGNIAYTLAKLGSVPSLISCSGTADDGEYMQHLRDLGISARDCLRLPGASTARAIIVTDPSGQQFTGFYPGPVPATQEWLDHLRRTQITHSPIFVQAPYPPHLMLASLQYASALPHRPLKIWCPGQYSDQLESDMTARLIAATDWIIVNGYEVRNLERHNELAHKLVIRTEGAMPIRVTYPNGANRTFDVKQVSAPIDPTGCGDAFIAGLLHELSSRSGDDWHTSLGPAIAAGCQAAANCLTVLGSQNHGL